jgi:hypothetical protein
MMGAAGSPAAGDPAAGGPAAALYVYGVVDAAGGTDIALPASGVGDPPRPLQTIADGAVAAVVSPLPGGAGPGRREDLEAHQRVLSEIVAATTVVPMRFGVVMDDERTLREQLLRRHAPALEQLLQDVRDRVQMSLKGYYAGDVLLREVVAQHPDIARRAAEVRDRPEAETRGIKIALGERIADAVSQRRDADAQRLVERLTPVVDDVRVEPPAGERMALNAQLLIGRSAREPLDAVVRALTEEEDGRIAFRYVGPLAPFSFADLSLDAEEPAWG